MAVADFKRGNWKGDQVGGKSERRALDTGGTRLAGGALKALDTGGTGLASRTL